MATGTSVYLTISLFLNVTKYPINNKMSIFHFLFTPFPLFFPIFPIFLPFSLSCFSMLSNKFLIPVQQFTTCIPPPFSCFFLTATLNPASTNYTPTKAPVSCSYSRPLYYRIYPCLPVITSSFCRLFFSFFPNSLSFIPSTTNWN